MGPSGRITDTENFNIVAKLTEGSGCGSSSQSGTDYDDLKFSPVVRVNETKLRLTLGPFFSQGSVGDL